MRQLLSSIFRTKPALSEEDRKRGIRWLMADGSCSMAMVTLQGGPFLAGFAIALGASNYEVGLLATIAFGSQFMQLVGLYLFKKFPRRRGTVVLAAGMSRALWVFIILTPLLFLDRGVTFLLQWVLIASLVGAVAGPAWNSLIRDIVPEDRMGSVFSTRMVIGMVLSVVLTVGGGYFVDTWKVWYPGAPLYGYSILFGLGFLFAAVGTFAISRLPEPELKLEEGAPMGTLLQRPLKDHNFRGLLGYVGVWTFAVNLAGPFFIVYLLKRLDYSMTLVTALVVTSQVANLFFLRIWGRLADRFSNKSVLRVSSPLFLIAVLAWAFTTLPEKHFLTLPLLFGIHILSGMSVAGVTLASTNIALKLSPREQAHAYMTVHGLTAAVAGGLAPILGGMFADFFATRELGIQLNWAASGEAIQMHAINFKALDFLFLIAFAVGLYSLRRLGKVTEQGEVEEKVVRQELLRETFSTVRSIGTIPGVRYMAAGPVSAVYSLLKRRGRDEESNEDGVEHKP